MDHILVCLLSQLSRVSVHQDLGPQGSRLGKLWILLPLVTLLLLPKAASGGGVVFHKELPPLPQATGFLPN